MKKDCTGKLVIVKRVPGIAKKCNSIGRVISHTEAGQYWRIRLLEKTIHDDHSFDCKGMYFVFGREDFRFPTTEEDRIRISILKMAGGAND